jgi:hypothetical protein
VVSVTDPYGSILGFLNRTKCYISFRYSDQYFVNIYYFCHAWYMSRLSHRIWFGRPTKEIHINRRENIDKRKSLQSETWYLLSYVLCNQNGGWLLNDTLKKDTKGSESLRSYSDICLDSIRKITNRCPSRDLNQVPPRHNCRELHLYKPAPLCTNGQDRCEISLSGFCGLVVRVLGYRSGGPGSVPGTTRKKK